MDRRLAGLGATAARTTEGAWWLWSFLGDHPDGVRSARVRCEGPPGAGRIGTYLAGCLLFSLGVKLFIDAGLGVDPLHAMVLGIVDALDLPLVGVGLVAGAVTLAFLALWSSWKRRLPPLGTFVTMALVGLLVDLWNAVGLERVTTLALAPWPMMLAGLLLDAYASALIIMGGVGIRVMDLVAIAARRRYGCSFLAAKMAMESGFVAAAVLLGGPVGPGTVAFLVLVVPFIPSFMWANARFLGLANHGLGSATPATSRRSSGRAT